MSDAKSSRPKGPWRALVALAIIAVAAVAWFRVGLLDLPAIPADVTLAASGLNDLESLKGLDDYLRAASEGPAPTPGAALARQGLAAAHRGDEAAGLETMRQAIRREPDNLVLANAYRMECFQLRRDFLKSAAAHSSLLPPFPAHIAKEPISFFESLASEHPSRETKLHLALAWVDEMLLFPALEIKAPASVEAVNLLSTVLDGNNPDYVPALFARGMNHLHRPARLVWPEAEKYPPDAAARDLARCIALGRMFRAGSNRLQARLAIGLGDAYVKAGMLGKARSWWQIAQNLSHDGDLQDATRRRYSWRDEETLDRLEEELDKVRGELTRPMTDLSMMWN